MDDKVVRELQNMSYLEWARIRNSSGTAGSFLKSYDDYGERKHYYKLSNYNVVDGIIGHECVNEIIVDRLLTILGVPHLEYKLMHANIVLDGKMCETYLCSSYDFKNRGESKLALDTYYEIERVSEKESMLEFCIRNRWEEYIYQMLAVDFLILNRDRHGANIEVLRDSRNKTIRLAPLFDHGLSLLCTCMTEDELHKFDILKNGPVQCCIGHNSVRENLDIIPKNRIPKLNPIAEYDRQVVMYGLEDIIPDAWQDRIWEMIWNRWKIYESFCNQK